MDFAPILVSVYDRKKHLENCISSLKNNYYAKDTILYIVSDNANKEEDKKIITNIRNYIKTISGFKEVRYIFNETNLGSHKSAGNAREKILNEHDTIIRLEDDIIVSKYFLKYLNEGLEKYKNDRRIFSICAYTPNDLKIPSNYNKDIYIWARHSGWGFATWKNRWHELDLELSEYANFIKDKKRVRRFNKIASSTMGILKADREGKIKAMDVRISFNMFLNDKYSIFPVKSLVRNTGFDGTGEHCGTNDKLLNEEIYQEEIKFPQKIEIDKRIFEARRKHHSSVKRDYIIPLIKSMPPLYNFLKQLKNKINK
jgi:hypothetical protein